MMRIGLQRLASVLMLLFLGACTLDSISPASAGREATQAVKAGDALMEQPTGKNQTIAARYYKKAAELGDSWGAYKYANMLFDGTGVPKDVPAAVGFYDQAASKGNPWAQYRLGEIYVDGTGVAKDPERGRALLEKASQQKNAWAQYRLGDIYLNGTDTPKDLDRALKYLTPSAKAGNDWAQLRLGEYYAGGIDVAKGRSYLEQSAAQGNSYAQYGLANLILDQDPTRAKDLLRKAAAAGNDLAAKRLKQLGG